MVEFLQNNWVLLVVMGILVWMFYARSGAGCCGSGGRDKRKGEEGGGHQH